MKQKTPQGLSLLDAAKATIEQFIKIRNKDPSNVKNDKYLLVTCDDGTGCIKISFKHSFVQFQEAYKSLEANSLTQIGNSLKEAFELLNGYRNVDNYGNGLYPFYVEPASIIILTDGGEFTNSYSITDQLTIPSSTSTVNYTIEPFRWDHRVFTLVYNFSTDISPSPLEPICEVTGGMLKTVCHMKNIFPMLEEVNAKINQIGVIVNFDGPSEVISSHKTLLLKQNTGYWPIPENYLPTHQILPRPAQPTILLQEYKEFNILDKFPYDQYEIETCNLTQYVLSTNKIFLAFVANSKGTGFGDPFGFVRAKGSTVYLFVLPYNFFKLFQLLDDLVNVHKLIPSGQWRQEMDKYLLSIPPYYIANLKPILKVKYSINSNVEEFKRNIKKKPPKEIIEVVEPDKMDRFELKTLLTKMRSELFGETLVGMNSIPVHEMGNFQEVLSRRQVLRNPFFEEELSTKRSREIINLAIDEHEIENKEQPSGDLIDKLPFHVQEKFKKRMAFLQYKDDHKQLTLQILKDCKNPQAPCPQIKDKKRKYVKMFRETLQSYKKTKWLEDFGFQTN